MKLDKKMQQCFKPHIIMHSLFGLGLGIVLISLIPSLANIWLGVLLLVVAIVWDMMRKS